MFRRRARELEGKKRKCKDESSSRVSNGIANYELGCSREDTRKGFKKIERWKGAHCSVEFTWHTYGSRCTYL